MFDPNIESFHKQWLDDGVLADIVNSSVPVIAASHHMDEYILDRLMLESYGFEGIGEPVDNPFCIESVAETCVAQHIWSLAETAKVPAQIIDREKHEACLALSVLADEAYKIGYAGVFTELLNQITIKRDGGEYRLQTLPYGHYLHVESGTIMIESADGPWLSSLKSVKIKYTDSITCPNEKASLYDKMLWTGRMLSKYPIKAENLGTATGI